MKKVITIFMLFLLVELMAEVVEQNLSQLTISELSAQEDIPLKKLKSILNISKSVPKETQLAELSLTETELRSVLKKFSQQRNNYYWSIVLVGMSIVFLSLILVAILIDRMKLLGKHRSSKKTSEKKRVTDVPVSSQNDIIAALTAIYLYEEEIEEHDKMILTMDKKSHDMWYESNIINMPNRIYFRQRNK